MPFDPVSYSPTPVALDADGEILMRAAEIVEKLGHYPGHDARGEHGEVCIGCAISFAKNGIEKAQWDTRYLDSVAPRLGFRSRLEIARWNVGRTASEVISRLRAAAQGVGL